MMDFIEMGKCADDYIQQKSNLLPTEFISYHIIFSKIVYIKVLLQGWSTVPITITAGLELSMKIDRTCAT